MQTNLGFCAGLGSAPLVVSGSGRKGWATAIVAAVELLALSKAFTPETSARTAIKIAIIFISTPIVNILVEPRVSEKVMIRRTGGTIWQHSRPQFLSIG